MSAPPKPKPASKWGSLLSGAVAGLESRLDTILAEDEQASARSRAEDAARKKALADQALTRTPSRSRPNDRLQERLAKVVVRSSRPSSELPSRAASPSVAVEPSRISLDSTASDAPSSAHPDDKTAEPKPSDEDGNGAPAETADEGGKAAEQFEADIKFDISQPSSRRASLEPDTPIDTPSRVATPVSISISDTRPSLDRGTCATDLEELGKIHREEIHAHLERIDALQSKLKYLASTASSQARAAKDEAAPGSLERRLAEKDEQIALLMAEGQSLSKKELNHLNTIKKFRAKVGEDEKNITGLKRRLAKAESNANEANERAQRAEAATKAAEQRAKQLEKVEKELGSTKSEKEESVRAIAELKRQLAAANERADEAEKRAQTNAVEAERKRVAELRDELSDARAEKQLVEDRAKTEMREAREDATRQQERAKVLEAELRGEIINLETKLEVLRSRTEEVSSNATGDSQIKLLRQIETLQTQYALASENWQGIESSLTSRVAALEKERDELAKRESDVRRKAREVNSKSRRLEEELDGTWERARALEHELSEQKTSMNKLQTRLAQADKELASATAGFEQQKKMWEAELAQKIDDEKTKWRLENATHTAMSPDTLSPSQYLVPLTPSVPGSMFGRKHPAMTVDTGLQGRRNISRNISSELLLSLDQSSSRRASALPQRTPGLPTPQRQGSQSSLSQLNGAGATATPPSIHTIDNDDAFERTSSPHRTVADMISVSTVGAGPSVQLVERMSAAVRRLESEKAVSKEELARLAAQRDEAREEVVALMREVEDKRAANRRVQKLERELRELDERYQTTLEMLGEKSEQVDELKNDVEDLKKIYKDLVDRTMK